MDNGNIETIPGPTMDPAKLAQALDFLAQLGVIARPAFRNKADLRRAGVRKMPSFTKKGPGRYRPNIEEMRARRGIA